MDITRLLQTKVTFLMFTHCQIDRGVVVVVVHEPLVDGGCQKLQGGLDVLRDACRIVGDIPDLVTCLLCVAEILNVESWILCYPAL